MGRGFGVSTPKAAAPAGGVPPKGPPRRRRRASRAAGRRSSADPAEAPKNREPSSVTTGIKGNPFFGGAKRKGTILVKKTILGNPFLGRPFWGRQKKGKRHGCHWTTEEKDPQPQAAGEKKMGRPRPAKCPFGTTPTPNPNPRKMGRPERRSSLWLKENGENTYCSFFLGTKKNQKRSGFPGWSSVSLQKTPTPPPPEMVPWKKKQSSILWSCDLWLFVLSSVPFPLGALATAALGHRVSPSFLLASFSHLLAPPRKKEKNGPNKAKTGYFENPTPPPHTLPQRNGKKRGASSPTWSTLP